MVHHNRPLFSWSDVERRPELERLEMVLKALPDEDLLRALEQLRGRGRDDYPIRAMWRALIAGIVFQHVSVESLLRELRRNPALLDVCGFDPLGPRRRPKREVVVGPGGEGDLEAGAATGRGPVSLEFLPIFEFSGEAGGGTGTDCGDDGEAAGAADGGGGGLRGASGV